MMAEFPSHAPISKDCPRCKETLRREEFYVVVSRPDGLSQLCKECEKARKKEATKEKQLNSKIVEDESGSVEIDRKFFLKELLRLYQTSDREANKIKCLELMSKISGFGNPDVPKDEASVIQSLMKSMKDERTGSGKENS